MGSRLRSAALVTLLALTVGPLPGGAASELPRVRIGLMVDGPWQGNDEVAEITRNEVLALTEGEFDVSFPEEAYIVGDWTVEGAQRDLERLLNDPEVDVVITWGLLGSNAVCCYGALPKPVIAPVVIDINLQGLPYENGASGIRNLNYVALPDNLINELRLFRQMVPFRKVAILTNEALLEAIPELPLRTLAMAQRMGIDYEYVPVGRSAGATLRAISDDTDAIYVFPLFHMAPEEYRKLIKGLNEARLPTFSALGGDDLELGMLASLAADDFFPRLSRRIALNLQRILLGEKASEIPVGFSVRDELRINMATARAIGVSPTWDLLIEAEVLHHEDLEALETRTLPGVVDEAIAANLDLRVQRRVVTAGAEEVRQARASLRPRLDLGALGVAIDDDRAAASLGSQAERTWSASAEISQLLFSDAAFANVEIQRRLQEARVAEFEQVRLDIALDAAVAYFNVLRANSLVQVRRNNLEVSRSNLELARIRRTIGAANPAEVYRWESQIATDRKSLIEAYGDQQITEIALNRLLHNDLGERFLTEEVTLEDPGLMTGDERFHGYTETPRRYEAFTDFMVADGLEASPELLQAEAALRAQERVAVASRRAFWAPTLGLRAELEEIVSRSGAGSEPISLPLFALPRADDSNWSLGLSASLPLYAGGGRSAERARAEESLAAARLRYDATAELVEQRIRIAMTQLWSSFPGVGLSRQAAEAAQKNLELVGDAYARGAVSIIDLLDAQTAALNADELAANAVYDFLIALMNAERAANRFDFFLGPEGTTAWFQRIGRFFDEREIPPLDPMQSSPPEPGVDG